MKSQFPVAERNDVNYFKTEYFTSTPKFGAFRLFYVMKQVQDNIANNGYQFRGVITAADPFPDFVIDPLNYRNSLVNSCIPRYKVHSNTKFKY
jgi:hypothetical protein